jgi:DNA polymerase III alpha subunit (gram-positive type)
MDYIILDLEWNSAFSEEMKRYVCEIFEIGAVKLDENLDIIDTFSEIIKPQILNTFNHRIVELTNIKKEEFESARNLEEVLVDFENFVGDDSLILTWSRSDIPVLLENYRFLNKRCKSVPMLKKYMDLQVYVQSFIEHKKGNQVSLMGAAEKLDIDISDLPPHRAINDSIISARCLKKTYDEKKFSKLIEEVNPDFYKRLFFKTKFISRITHPAVKKSDLIFYCEECKKQLSKKKAWEFKNRSFYSVKRCTNCNIDYKCTLQIKETFDGVVKTRRCKKIVNTEDSKIDRDNSN